MLDGDPPDLAGIVTAADAQTRAEKALVVALVVAVMTTEPSSLPDSVRRAAEDLRATFGDER